MSLRYTPYFCEENVWHLCAEPRFEGRDGRVAFISNPRRTCAFWCQRAAPSPWQPVIWDYHVIYLVRLAFGWEVWDLDSTLEVPTSAGTYLEATFGAKLPERPQTDELSPLFRVLEAAVYREQFSSDRGHMRGQDGAWLQPPPPWPSVVRPGVPSFLRWSMMADDDRDVLSLDELKRLLALDS